MTRRLAMVAALGLALLAPGPARAGTTHVVQHGESLSAIAADAYGSAWKWVYVAEANKLPGSSVRPGRRLKLPTARPYVVHHGDSLAGLAQRFLGSSERYVFLAKLNGIADPRSLAPGTRSSSRRCSGTRCSGGRPSPGWPGASIGPGARRSCCAPTTAWAPVG